MEILAWIGVAQSLFASILMISKKEKSVSDKILYIWLLLLGAEFLTCALDYKIYGHPLLSSSFLLFNPALTLYIRSLTRPDFKLKYAYLLHLIPFLFFETYAYAIAIPFEFDTFFHADDNFSFRMIFTAATIISWLVYNPWSLFLILNHRKRLLNEKSNIDSNENLTWLRSVTLFYVTYCVIVFFIAVYVYLSRADYIILTFYNYSALLILIYMISFYGLRQQKIALEEENTEVLLPEEIKSYKNSILTPEAKAEIKNKILDFVENKKAYLNPDLNMDVLSESIGIPKYQITEVLNTELGKNFFRFINSYRVSEVIRQISAPQLKYSIEAIGYDCGFSSKSSFYTVFKSITGETPTACRQRILEK